MILRLSFAAAIFSNQESLTALPVDVVLAASSVAVCVQLTRGTRSALIRTIQQFRSDGVIHALRDRWSLITLTAKRHEQNIFD